MITAIDTNILIDLFTGPEPNADSASAALKRATTDGSLALSIICYSELAARFTLKTNLDRFLDQFALQVDLIDRETSFLAGRLYHDYRRRGGTRGRILPDFLVAAHAQLRADRLLTRDKRFFGASFPRLKAVSPADLI